MASSAGDSGNVASVSQLFAWGDLTEAEYRRQKTAVERDLTMLPDDDRLVLFDRHRKIMVSMDGEAIR
jgi:hypothetical protein